MGNEKNTIAVFPQGLIDDYGILHWNAGFDFSEVDDVTFLSELARQLQSENNIKNENIFICGISNGGWMSYHMLLKKPNLFRAAGSVIGRMGNEVWKNRDQLQPVPIIQISGALDNWQNDLSDDIDGGWGGAPDVDTQIEFWAELNQATMIETNQVTSNTISKKYTNGVNNNQVWYYIAQDIGHDVPSGGNDNINTWDVFFEFFELFKQ